MQQEYWVNVYKNGKGFGLFHHDLGMAVALSSQDVAYRIHVKMKEKKPISKYAHKYLEKGDWMS